MKHLWTTREDAYLAVNFSSASMPEMVEATGRTKDAIYSRAKVLGLTRNERVAHREFIRGTVLHKDTLPKKRTVRDVVISELTKHIERTGRQLMAATGATKCTIWKVCDRLRKQGNIHVSRFQESEISPGNWEAVYRINAGVDAVSPAVLKQKKEAKDNPHKVQPIPHPTLSMWHDRVFAPQIQNA